MTGERWTIVIDKDGIDQAALTPAPPYDLGDESIELQLDSFAMTANNVTYAALGRPSGLFDNGKGYWDFFAPGEGPGVLPVWGFATVTRSNIVGVSLGEQFYGFFPMASHAVLSPARIGPLGFSDNTPHRRDMAAVYNSYQRVAALERYRVADHDWWPVFRPLYLTGWLIADQFDDEGDHGAEQIVVVGASAKTAIAFAHATAARARRPRLIGLTSARGKAFLKTTGVYDALITYSELSALPVAATAVVDIAGDLTILQALKDHLGERLRHGLGVGRSHWEADAGRPWPTNSFFAPGRIQKRMQDWGSASFRARTGTAWTAFLADAKTLFKLDKRCGRDAALAAYREAVMGLADPQAAIVIAP